MKSLEQDLVESIAKIENLTSTKPVVDNRSVSVSFSEVCHSLTGVVGFSYPYSTEFQTLSLINFRNVFILTFQ